MSKSEKKDAEENLKGVLIWSDGYLEGVFENVHDHKDLEKCLFPENLGRYQFCDEKFYQYYLKDRQDRQDDPSNKKELRITKTMKKSAWAKGKKFLKQLKNSRAYIRDLLSGLAASSTCFQGTET